MGFCCVLIEENALRKLLYLQGFVLVPGAGLEPARCYQRGILNHNVKTIYINWIGLIFKI